MPGAVTVQRSAHSVLIFPTVWEIEVKGPSDLKITVPAAISVPAGGDASFDIALDAHNVPPGQTRFATLTLTSEDRRDVERELHIPITIVRGQAPVTLDKSCDPPTFSKNSTTTCTLNITNPGFTDASISVSDSLPRQLQLAPGSVVGATASGNGISFSGRLPGSQPPDITIAPGASPAAGYLPLSLFGAPSVAGVGDDTIANFNVPPFIYGGEINTRIGVASNGYVVVGGGSGPDISISNQNFPDPNRPNNVIAPFWTDLNPGAGGAMRIATLTDKINTWIVLDWDAVREFSTPNANSFEIWIGINGVEDVSIAYGTIHGSGDGGFLSVGAENKFGNRGGTIYYNGTGSLPAINKQLRVTAIPGSVEQ